MKNIIRNIIVIFVLICITLGMLNIISYAEYSNIQSFENGVPDNWKSISGTLETSTKHYKHENKSLLWKWKKEDKLNVIQEKNMDEVGKNGGIIFWLYNENAIDNKLTFNLGTTEQINNNNNPLYTFDCNLNFTGWRAIWVNLRVDATNPNFEGKKEWKIEQMEIIAPNSIEEGEIYVDLVEFVSSIYWCRSQDYQVTNQRSSDVKGDIWQRNYYYINKKPYLELPSIITQEEKKAFEIVEERLDNWLYGTEKYENTSEMQTRMKSLNKYIKNGLSKYESLNIERHEDGNITGVPLFGATSPYAKTGKTFSREVAEQIFLPIVLDYKINKNEESLNKIMDLFDYFNDQGWAEGSGLGSLNHETLRSTGYFISVYLMRDELDKTGRLDREIGTINWHTNFGKLYVDPEIDYEATTSDELRTHSLNRLIYVLLMEDSPEKVRAMNSYINWFNNALRLNPNMADIIKPDYLGFHHQGVYMGAYAPQGYHLSSVIIYLLHDTQFEISSTAQYNLKQALITHDILTNQTEVPIFLRGRIVNSKEIGTEISQYPYRKILNENNTWIIDPYGNGYYIPNASNINIVRNTQSSREQTGKSDTTGEYTTAWIDHSIAPQNAEYEYAIKVQTTPAEMETYSKNVNYEVLQKDENAHIVKNKDSNTIGYAIFGANKKLQNTEVISITDTPILAMVTKNENELELCVSDPDLRVSNTNNMVNSTMKKARLEIKGKWQLKEKSEDAKILEVKEDSTIIEFSCIDGKTIKISLQKEELEEAKITSNVYTIKENYISRVSQKTTVNEFKQNVEANREITIVDKDGNKLEDNEIIKTGMTVKVGDKLEYTLIVIGDINGDGKITVTDIAKVKLHITEKEVLTGIEFMAGDANSDGTITITDLAQIKIIFIGLPID